MTRFAQKAIRCTVIRSSKTVEISNENSHNSSPKDHHESTFTDAIIQNEEDSLILTENFGTVISASTSKKDFRIKNISKPFNSLNTALMTFSTPKALAVSHENAKDHISSSTKKENSNSNSPKNNQSLSPNKKKRSKFGEEGNSSNGEKPFLTLIELEGKKSNSITPTSDSFKKCNGFGAALEKKEKPKIKKVIASPNPMNINYSPPGINNTAVLHSNNNTITNFKDPKESPNNKEKDKDKRFSMQESKKLENIRLDKETLRDLNRYTDKNFIKSIKASLRKLEIIEKISEDNFRETDRVQMTMSQSPNKRHSTNDSRARLLPLITPDHSPKKPVIIMKNSRLPKN